jgi:hypothetical protein
LALESAEAWDAMRDGTSAAAFTIPSNPEDWRSLCPAVEHLATKARMVARFADRTGCSALRSYGVGTAGLEYNIHVLRPHLPLHVSDYGRGTVERLRAVFPEAASIEAVDLLQAPLPDHAGELVLLHRIDTEFSQSEWKTVYSRLADARAEHVLFVPHQLLGPETAARELARRLRARLTGCALIRAGWIRSRSLLRSLWSHRYEVADEVTAHGDLFILLRRTAG